MSENIQRKLHQNANDYTTGVGNFQRLHREIEQSNDQFGNNERQRVEIHQKLTQFEKTKNDIQIHYLQTNEKLEQCSYRLIHNDVQSRPNHIWNEARIARQNQQSYDVDKTRHHQKQYR